MTILRSYDLTLVRAHVHRKTIALALIDYRVEVSPDLISRSPMPFSRKSVIGGIGRSMRAVGVPHTAAKMKPDWRELGSRRESGRRGSR